MPTFEIHAPDGKVYHVDAPEGAKEEDAFRYVASQHGYSAPERHKVQNFDSTPDGLVPSPTAPRDPTEGDTETYFDLPSLSFKQRPGNSMAAFGGGAERFVRGAGNLAVKGLNKLLPGNPDLSDLITGDKRAIKGGFFSDEAVREQDAADKPLEDKNSLMYAAGEAAPTLPVNEAIEGSVGALRAVPKIGHLLGSTLAKMGASGAVDAAAVGDVDNAGKEAIQGGATNMALGATLGVLGRATRGIIQKSKAAEDLENLASQHGKDDMFVPASLAADPKGDITSQLGRTLYREALPLIPGVEGRLQNQQKEALSQWRQMALEEADPTGSTIVKGAAEDGLQAKATLKDAFDNEYKNTVSSYAFNVPSDFRQQVGAKVRAAMPNVDSTTLKKVTDELEGQLNRYSNKSGVIDGGNLMNTKAGASNLYSQMDGGPEKKALSEGSKVFDDMIETQLKQGGAPQNLADLQRYQELAEPYKAFKQVGDAASAAAEQKGKFTPGQLASAAGDQPSAMLHLAQTGSEVLGQPVAKPSSTGKIAAYAVGAMGAMHHLPALAATVAGGNLLATKTAQRAMMGDTAAQKALANLVKTHPEMAHTIRAIMSGIASTQAASGADPNAGP
jgi:hypothetical protein